MTQKKRESRLCMTKYWDLCHFLSSAFFSRLNFQRAVLCVSRCEIFLETTKKAHRCHLNWLLFHVRCYTLSLVSRVWWIRTIFCSSFSLVDCIAIDFSLSREYMLLLRYVRRAHNPRLSRAFMPSIASNMSLSINNDLINLLIESSIEASKTQ